MAGEPVDNQADPTAPKEFTAAEITLDKLDEEQRKEIEDATDKVVAASL